MKSKSLKKVSTGSMADIAFLLLVFWLMTTSLSEEQGLLRMLPAFEDNAEPKDIPDKSVFNVYVNLSDEILVENQEIEIIELKELTKAFLCNGGVFSNKKVNEKFAVRKWLRRKDLISKIQKLEKRLDEPEAHSRLTKLQKQKLALDYFGDFKQMKADAIISVQNDKATSYETYIQVQNELTSAINELRDDLSLEHFNKTFSELDSSEERDKIIAIRQVYPQKISEAEFKE